MSCQTGPAFNHSWPPVMLCPAACLRDLWHSSTDGRGLSDFGSNTSGQSLTMGDSKFPSGREHCDFIKLRLGRLETRVTTSGGRPSNKKCRHCVVDDESLNHVLQTCRTTHGLRIRRHDEVRS